MANVTVYERGDSPYVWAGFFCPKSLKYRYAKTPFRKDAPRSKFDALQWAGKRAVEGNVRKTMLAAEAWGSWVPQWLQETFRGSPLTLTRYSGAWKRWVQFLSERKILYPAALKHSHLLDYVKWREDPTTSPRVVRRNTVLIEIKVMSSVMQEAVRRGFAQGNPALRPGIRAEPKRHFDRMDPHEEALIRDLLKAKPAWMSECFEIAMKQGCRLSETMTPLDHVNLDRGTITMRTKGGRTHTTALHPDLRSMMESKKKSGAKWTVELPRWASKDWFNFFKKENKERLGHLSFHSTRVTVVTKMCLANVPEAKTLAYIGHASTTTHRIYQRLKAQDLADCTAVL